VPMVMSSDLKTYLPPRIIQLWEAFLRRLSWNGGAVVGQQVEVSKNS
jgi:hypothetical protein